MICNPIAAHNLEKSYIIYMVDFTLILWSFQWIHLVFHAISLPIDLAEGANDAEMNVA
jgi:hypothetical protein